MRFAVISSAIVAGALACLCPEHASAQRAFSVVVSEEIDSWTVVCIRDLVTDEVSCSMLSPIEMHAEQSWQGLERAMLSVAVEHQNAQPRPAIRIVAPDFSFGATFRFDARRGFRIEGNCGDADCRASDAFALPLAEELARSTIVIIRGASGFDLRARLTGYAEAWSRLLSVTADRARAADAPAELVPTDRSPPTVPVPPSTSVQVRSRARDGGCGDRYDAPAAPVPAASARTIPTADWGPAVRIQGGRSTRCDLQ